MDIYKLVGYGTVEIGDTLETDSYDYVKVLSIVKVDFQSKTIWVSGVLNEKMSV